MTKIRLRFTVSGKVAEFLESEKVGTLVDTVEGLLLEREALLFELVNLNVTADQLGINQRPLSALNTRAEKNAIMCEFVAEGTPHQAVYIRDQLRGYANQSKGIEALTYHVQYLRKTVEDFRFDCARAVLERRIKSKSSFNRPFKSGLVAC